MNKEYLLNESKYFCMAPWVTMHFWPSGQAMPCCVMLPDNDNLSKNYMGNLKTSTIKELWNTEQMCSLRRNMMSDRPSRDCRRCYQQEKDANIHTLRKQLNEQFGDMFSRVQLTNDNGSHDDPKFYYWDVRFNNLCNLRCLSCGPEFSSKWYNDAKKTRVDYSNPALLELPKSFWEDALPSIKEVRYAYFAGGEPLITEEHYRMLDVWLEADNTDIEISYTTNFTKVMLGNKNVFDYWNKFNNVRVGASLDDNWERAEYLRKDTVWTDIVANRKRMIQECPDTTFFLSSTISAYNVWHWPDFHKEWIEEGLVDPNQLNLTILTHPERMSIQMLPVEFKKEVADKWYKHIEYLKQVRLACEWQTDTSNLEGIINFMYTEDTLEKWITDFLTNNNRLDKIRNNSMYEAYPELLFFKNYENEK